MRLNVPKASILVPGTGHLEYRRSLNAADTPTQLDLNNPEQALKAYRKVLCSLVDGEPTLYWWRGHVYSRVPGERDRLLFQIQGMNIAACGTVTDDTGGYGYRRVSREVMLYLDPNTEQILRTWQNPWTGKEVRVFHVANDPVNSKPIFAHRADGSFKFNGTFLNGKVLMTVEIPLFYPNPLGGDYQDYVGGTYHALEMFSHFMPEEELLDANSNRVENVSISWCRVSPWLPWMEMGDRVGLLIFHGAGLRLRSADDLPDILKQEIKTRFPAFCNPPPLDDERPNETTWTNFPEQLEATPNLLPSP